MSPDNTLAEYNIDRKAASKLLKVSIRTVDRYVKQKKLSTRLIGGRVWLNKAEIRGFRADSDSAGRVDSVNVSTPMVTIDTNSDNMDNMEVFDQENVHMLSTRGGGREKKSGVYKKLYEDLKEEIGEKQERLEIANYRVGQLEAQVKNSIPMLEYHRENFERSQKEETLKQEVIDSKNLIGRLSQKLRYEKITKRVFIFILLMVLALQPLWLIYIYR